MVLDWSNYKMKAWLTSYYTFQKLFNGASYQTNVRLFFECAYYVLNNCCALLCWYVVNLINAAAVDEIMCSRNGKLTPQNNSSLIHSKWMKHHWINFQHLIHTNDIM